LEKNSIETIKVEIETGLNKKKGTFMN
jgi:hypothetical protein